MVLVADVVVSAFFHTYANFGTNINNNRDVEVIITIDETTKKKALEFSYTRNIRGSETSIICKKLAMIDPIYFDSENSSEINLALYAWTFANITADEFNKTNRIKIVVEGVLELLQHVPNDSLSDI